MSARVVTGLVTFVYVLVMFISYDIGYQTAKNDQTNINVPTCAELDNVGYDGLATCLDEDGNYQTPGR